MRCQKCGYNSFEHNQVCPKCQKSLSVLRTALQITVPEPNHFNFFQAANQNFGSDLEEDNFGADDYQTQNDNSMDVDIEIDMDIQDVDTSKENQPANAVPTLSDLLDDVDFNKKK